MKQRILLDTVLTLTTSLTNRMKPRWQGTKLAARHSTLIIWVSFLLCHHRTQISSMAMSEDYMFSCRAALLHNFIAQHKHSSHERFSSIEKIKLWIVNFDHSTRGCWHGSSWLHSRITVWDNWNNTHTLLLREKEDVYINYSA